MGYGLKPGEKLSRGFYRIAKEQTHILIKSLAEVETSRQAEAIHLARLTTKRMRALLRLVRGGLGKKNYTEHNQAFRRVARSLSQLRDAEVRLKTLDKLVHQPGSEVTDADVSGLRRAWLRQIEGRFVRAGRWQRAHSPELQATLSRIKTWPQKGVGCGVLRSEMKKTYRRCLKAFIKSTGAATPENLHEWRRRTKDLWLQLCLVKPVSSKRVITLANGLERLGKCLGEDHDLTLIEAAVKIEGLSKTKQENISKLIRARRTQLQHSAFKLGRRLCEDKPAAFARRLARHCF